ncbi:hypothetical protein I4699_18435, partial [Xanthomonas hortorum pv. carotae]|nr:hypothetical protein [Xanthomonas hortorum pv. carotae]
RRHFLKSATLGAIASGLAGWGRTCAGGGRAGTGGRVAVLPRGAARVISTWDFGIAANQEAWKILSTGASHWMQWKPACAYPKRTRAIPPWGWAVTRIAMGG